MANSKRLLLLASCLALTVAAYADTSPTVLVHSPKEEKATIVVAHADVIGQYEVTDVTMPFIRYQFVKIEDVEPIGTVYHDPAVLPGQYYIPDRAKPYTLVKNVPNFKICNKAKGERNRYHNTFYPPDIA